MNKSKKYLVARATMLQNEVNNRPGDENVDQFIKRKSAALFLSESTIAKDLKKDIKKINNK